MLEGESLVGCLLRCAIEVEILDVSHGQSVTGGAVSLMAGGVSLGSRGEHLDLGSVNSAKYDVHLARPVL